MPSLTRTSTVTSSRAIAHWYIRTARAGNSKPGASFFIPDGFDGLWEIIETTTKHFVIQNVAPAGH